MMALSPLRPTWTPSLFSFSGAVTGPGTAQGLRQHVDNKGSIGPKALVTLFWRAILAFPGVVFWDVNSTDMMCIVPPGLIKRDNIKHSVPLDVANKGKSHNRITPSGQQREERPGINFKIKISHPSARQPAYMDC